MHLFMRRPLSPARFIISRLKAKWYLSAIAFLAVTFTLVLVTVLNASYLEIINTTRYIGGVPATQWAVGPGADNVFTGSLVTTAQREAIRRFPGVVASGAMNNVFRTVSAGPDGRSVSIDAVLSSYEPGTVAAPSLTKGRGLARPREAVIDEHLAAELDIALGQTVQAAGQSFTVVGLSRNSNAYSKELVFIGTGDFARIFGANIFKAVALQTDGRFDPVKFQQTIGLDVFSHSQWVKLNREYWMRSVGQLFSNTLLNMYIYVFGVMALIGVISVLLVHRDPALMSAIGFTVWRLVRLEFQQAIVVALAAFVAMLALANPAIQAQVNAKNFGMTATLQLATLWPAVIVFVISSVLAPIIAGVIVARTQPVWATRGEQQ